MDHDLHSYFHLLFVKCVHPILFTEESCENKDSIFLGGTSHKNHVVSSCSLEAFLGSHTFYIMSSRLDRMDRFKARFLSHSIQKFKLEK